MSDESGEFPFPKLRKSTIWVPVGILAAAIGIAVAWGTTQDKVATQEQRTDRIEAHLSATDAQVAANKEEIAVLKERLTVIIEQLGVVNAKLDRAEEERHK